MADDELSPGVYEALPDYWKEVLSLPVPEPEAEGATGAPARGSASEALAAPSTVPERRAGEGACATNGADVDVRTTSTDLDRARAYVAHVPGVAEGSRNTELNALAYRVLERFLLGFDEYEALLLSWSARCAPPLPERDARSTLRSAWKACARKGAAGAKRSVAGATGAPARGSAGEAPAAPATHGLAFLTVADLFAQTRDEVDWLWDGYLAREAVTLLASPPKSGKSTLAFGLLEQLHRAAPFLGRPTTASSAVYLSEEPLATLRQKAERFHLDGGARPALLLVSRRRHPNQTVPFAAAMREAAHAAAHSGARLIIVDTLAAWAGLKAEEENNAGTCEEVMRHFRDAAAFAQAAVLVVHHTRKDGDAVRGSTALAGAADVVLILQRSGDHPTRRRLVAESRYTDTPPLLTFALNAEGYRLETEQAQVADRYAEVLAALPEAPAPGLTVGEVAVAAGGSAWATRKALKELQIAGMAAVTGEGTRLDPFRYQRSVRADGFGVVPPGGPNEQTQRQCGG